MEQKSNLNIEQLLRNSKDEWTPAPRESHEEIKLIHKNLRKRNTTIIAVSLVLAAVLLVITMYGVIPFTESLYWNPTDTTYKDRSDLQTTLHTYTELFLPGYELSIVSHQRTGFATWALDIPLITTATNAQTVYNATLEKNELQLSQQLTDFSGRDYYFTRWRKPTHQSDPQQESTTAKLLNELPAYVQLEAALTFSGDLSMEELLEFRNRWPDLNITWTAIRCFEPNGDWTPYCGMDPFTGGLVYGGISSDYPQFDLNGTATGALQLEQHFLSLLQYSANRLEAGRGIAHGDNPNLYNEILEYINENGVYTYGCIVTASPAQLLTVMEDRSICFIDLNEGWIAVE